MFGARRSVRRVYCWLREQYQGLLSQDARLRGEEADDPTSTGSGRLRRRLEYRRLPLALYMRFLDLLSHVVSSAVPGENDDYEITARARLLADQAKCDRLTPAVLAKPGSRTAEPLVSYLDDAERPQYVLLGTELLISDEADSTVRKHPARRLVVSISDERIVFVVGGRFSDELFEVPLSSVTMAYLDEDRRRRHVVVEADRDGAEMTFFADVTIDPHTDDLDSGVAYVKSAVQS